MDRKFYISVIVIIGVFAVLSTRLPYYKTETLAEASVPIQMSENKEVAKRKALSQYNKQKTEVDFNPSDSRLIRYSGYADIPGYIFDFDYDQNGNPDYFGYTEQEFKWLSLLIANEASDDWKDKIYVGSVVLNRVKHPAYYYDKSIEDVIFDTYPTQQYTCWYGDKQFPKAATEKDKAAAYECLKYGSQLPYNVVFQSQEQQGDGLYEKVGAHYYCWIY